ncbi:MAG: DUF6502 family protein [Pseudomonadota bacterium]
MDDEIRRALIWILRPVARLLIATGTGVPRVEEILRAVMIDEAKQHLSRQNSRVNVSSLSLATGLQRREVKRLLEIDANAGGASLGPAPRVVRRWLGSEAWRDAEGRPLQLPRRSEAEPSFEKLVAEVSTDIHHRAVLETLLAQKVVVLDAETDCITLLSVGYLPSGSDQLSYLGRNAGDHLSAAVANVTSAQSAPFYERAAHFNGLSPLSIVELDALARDEQQAALSRIAEHAAYLQAQDEASPGADLRFRCGAYIFHTEDRPGEDDT